MKDGGTTGRIVIACYRPKAGQRDALRALLRDHVPTLRSQGLATDREPITMEAQDGTFLEVFEWTSAEAIESAHTNPVVAQMWDRFGEACDFVPLVELQEAGQPFADFRRVGRDEA